MANQLKSRFIKLWTRNCLDAKQSSAEEVWSMIESHYTESHRFYHTLNHIEDCLSQFDLVKSQVEQPELVELALWFHDFIYQSGHSDNEKNSAEEFLNLASSHLKNDKLQNDKIVRLIMATTHRLELVDNDEKLIVDIDLSSFGSSKQDYKKHNEYLRNERPNLSDSDYLNSHNIFLLKLSEKRIFKTDFFFDKYETIARNNIKDRLEEMNSV